MFITRDDIVAWAEKAEAQFQLPELVCRLVDSTAAGLQSSSFPAGKGIGKSGFDGEVHTCADSEFVPRGRSVWELSVQEQVTKKANKDYEARRVDASTEVTFCFVTGRGWDAGKEWAAGKRAEQIWSDVRAYDADDLDRWLRHSAPARSWFARILGKGWDVLPLEDHWEEWSARTVPSTLSFLLLAGRDQARAECLRWLEAPATMLACPVEDSGEAAAFLHAVLEHEPTRASSRARALIVGSEPSLRQLASEHTGLLLVARGIGIDACRTAAASGHTFCASSPGPLAAITCIWGPSTGAGPSERSSRWAWIGRPPSAWRGSHKAIFLRCAACSATSRFDSTQNLRRFC